MVPTNRKEFLALLRDVCGYKGAEDVAEVKKFIEAEGHTLVDENDNPLDVDDIWSKTGGKKIALNPKAGETDAEREERLSGKNVGFPTRPTGNINRAARADAIMAKAGESGTRIGDARSFAMKSYERRIKAGTAVYNDPETAEFCGAWIRAKVALLNNQNYSRFDEDVSICEKVASSYNPTTGSSLVPTAFSNEVFYLTEQYGVTRRLCRVVPMTTDVLSVSRQIGTFTISHIGQNQQESDGDVNTDLVQLTAREVYGLARFPNSFREDASVNVADLYTRAMAEGLAIREDSDFTIGDGTSTYGGHVGLVVRSNQAASAANWSAFTEANIMALPGNVENVNISRCAFMCSRQFYFQVMAPLTTASGRGSINEFLTVNGLGGKADAQWRGWPVYFNQLMPTATGSGQRPLYFGEYDRAAMFGDRKSLEITTSDHRYFDYNQQALRLISRYALNVHMDGRGSTYGPIVHLATS